MKGLNGWLRQLESNQSAVLATLLKELENLTSSEKSSGIEVGQVIMKDANLTSNIIRVGNSVMYNTSNIPVTTVSRAILNIGFEQLRSICISIKVLENVLNENPSDMLISRLATTLHASAQARALVSHKSHSVQEEVYVASLLSNLTELLILASLEGDAKEFTAGISSVTTRDEKNSIAEKTLGVSLKRLSKTLMKRWRIEGMVHDVLQDLSDKDELIEAIDIGSEIARTALYGWDSPEYKKTIERVAEFQKKEPSDVRKSIEAVAELAEESVSHYGNVALAGKIVKGEVVPAKDSTHSEKSGQEDSVEEAPLLMPEPKFQLKALQELTMMMSGDFNINRVFKTILLGLNKGVGLERCTLAFFDSTHLKLASKYSQGAGTQHWLESFVLSYTKSETGFLYQLFKQDQTIWVGSDEFKSYVTHLPNEYKAITGANDFFIAPLSTEGRRIGVIYADMGVSHRALTPDLFDGYKMFIQQARMALTILASKSK
jgi:HD-like signal output (HDOD) protein